MKESTAESTANQALRPNEWPNNAGLPHRSITSDNDSIIKSIGVHYQALTHLATTRHTDQAFFIFRELYFQQLDGHLDPRLWGPTETAMRDINAYPGVQAWWRTRWHRFNKEFVKFVDQMQQTAGPPRMYREPMKDE